MSRLKKWTESEDAIIRDFWPQPGSISCHAHRLPGRSVQSIEKRARKLALPHRIIWTAEQDEHLRKVWKSGGRIKSHLSEFPGHSLAAINTRAHDLGLGRRGKHGFGEDPASWKVITKQLQAGDSTCTRLAEDAGMHQSTVYAYLSKKHAAGEVHIVGWQRLVQGAKSVPVYRFGPGIDKPRQVLQNAQKEKKYRQADLHKRVIAGETVRTINPFASAAGLVVAPKGQIGRIYRQSMSVDDDREAA